MSDPDLTMRNYMKDPKVFTDVFNYALHQGERIIDPDALQEVDPEEIIFINGRIEKRLAAGSGRKRLFKWPVNECEDCDEKSHMSLNDAMDFLDVTEDNRKALMKML